MLPFLFAASAVQVGGSVTWMLFHDTVLMAVDGVGKTLVAVGPPNRYEEIAGHANVTLWACRPRVEARGLAAGQAWRATLPRSFRRQAIARRKDAANVPMACSIGDAPKSRPSSLIAPVAPKHSGSASRFKERAKEILTEARRQYTAPR
jgi:hypothetical protein